MTKNRTRTLLEWAVAVLAVASLLIRLVTDWHTAGIVVQALGAVAACCVLLVSLSSGKEEPANASRRGDHGAQRGEGRNGRGRNGRSGRNASTAAAASVRRGEEGARPQGQPRNRADVKTAPQRGEAAPKGARNEAPARPQQAAGVKEGEASASSRRRRRNRGGRGEAAAAEQPQGSAPRNAAAAPAQTTQTPSERPAERRKPAGDAARKQTDAATAEKGRCR